VRALHKKCSFPFNGGLGGQPHFYIRGHKNAAGPETTLMVCVSIYQCFNKNVIASNNWASKVTVYVHVHVTSLIYNSDKSLYNNSTITTLQKTIKVSTQTNQY